MRYIKILLKIALALLGLALAGLAVFVILFDPNDYRDRVAELVREQTGRELVLAGPLELSVFPWLAVEAENVALGNAPGFGAEPMLRIARVSLGLQVLPLLSGELRLGDVVLTGLDLSLSRNAEGRTNWDDLLEPAGRTSPPQAGPQDSPSVFSQGGVQQKPQPTAEAAASSSSEPSAFRIADASLQGLQAEDVRLVWDDQTARTRYEFSGGALQVGAVRFGAPLDLEAEFDFRLAGPEPDNPGSDNPDSDKPGMSGRFRLAGNLAFDLDKKQYAMPRLTLALRAEGAELPGNLLEASLAVDQLRADLDKGTASASAFTLIAYGAQVSGSCAARDLFAAPAASGVLELARCNARSVLSALGLEQPDTTDNTALTSLGATLRFDYYPSQLDLPFLSLDLDGQHLEGRGSARLDQPEYTLVLNGEQLDLDRYLPPKEGQGVGGDPALAAAEAQWEQDAPAPQPPAEANATSPDAEPQWLATARNTSLTADLGLTQLRVGNMDLSGLQLKLMARHGVVAVEPLNLRLRRDADEYQLTTGKLFGDLHTLGLRVDLFTLAAPGGGVSGSLAVSNLLAAPEASGKLVLNHLDLRRLSQALADLLPVELPKTSDPTALTDLNGSVDFSYAPQLLDVPAFDLQLDGCSLRGRVRWRKEPASYEAVLHADRLDLDRYLPAAAAEQGGGAQGAAPGVAAANATQADAASGDGAGEADNVEAEKDLVAEFRAMRADVDLNVAVLKYQGLEFSDIKTVFRAKDGKAVLEPCQFALGKGQMKLSWDFNAGSAEGQGRSSLTTTVQGLALGNLLQRFAKINDVQGTLTLRTIEPLTWTGLDTERFQRSLDGSVGFAVRDGQYPGLNLFEMLTVVDKLSRAVLEGGADDKTRFGEATGTVVARKGRVNCDDLCVKAPGLRAGGAGFVNLPDGSIDYLVRAMAVPDSSGQGGASCGEYYGIPVPVRVSGTLEHPRYWISAEEYAASVARGAVGLLGDVVKGGAGAVGTVLRGGADAAQDVAKSVVQEGAEAVEGGASAVGGAVGGAVEGAVEGAVKGGAEAVDEFIKELKGAF